MLISIQGNRLICDFQEYKLRPYQKSQFVFWGFQISEDLLISNSTDDRLINLVLSFCQKESIEFKLSDEVAFRIGKLEERNKKLKDLFEKAKQFKEGKPDFDDFNNHLNFLRKAITNRDLREHQEKASYHLYLLGNGANFSVPGSGKTTVVLCVYERLRQEGLVNTLFVVGPPSSFGPWKNEFKEVLGRDAVPVILAGGNRTQRQSKYYATSNISELYLTTYQSLQNDVEYAISFIKHTNIKAFVVIDEAHYIKQQDGIWANAVILLGKSASFKSVLTGTPMPRSLSDVFNLFEFLWPDSVFLTQEARARIKLYEESGDIENAISLLESSIAPLFYRVRKKELKLKDQVFHDPIQVCMKEYESRIYEAISKRIGAFSQKDIYIKNIDFINRLKRGRVIRLRQTVSYPKLLITAIENYGEDLLQDMDDLKYIISKYDELETPGKLDYLLGAVNKIIQEGQKVVIWSNFLNTISLIISSLTNTGIYCKKITGNTPIVSTDLATEENRDQIISEFIDTDSGLNVLVLNPQACAESISLHKTCHNAIYYDLSYNCAQYLQSMDRIHRVGGSEFVEAHYYFLQYENTIDRDILENLQMKGDRMASTIDKDYEIYSLDMFEDQDEIDAYNRLFNA